MTIELFAPDPRPYADIKIGLIDRQHLVHATHVDAQSAPCRQHMTLESSPPTKRHNRYTMVGAAPDQLLDLLRTLRIGHSLRPPGFKMGQVVCMLLTLPRGLGQAIPKPIELAKMFGFDDVAGFEADWIEYLKSTDFK